MTRRFPAGALITIVIIGVLALIIATQGTGAANVSGVPLAADTPTATPAASSAPAPTATPLSIDQLSLIQPGLGTVMVEYAHRMAAVWFAAEAGNWDMAAYQIIEMREIQETGEITRPARAQALKGFETGFLDPLNQTIKAKDKAQFETSYRAALQGCNSCHASQTSADFKQGFKFVHVQVPKDTIESLVSWSP